MLINLKIDYFEVTHSLIINHDLLELIKLSCLLELEAYILYCIFLKYNLKI
jgi:hypothetical protein